MKASRRSHKLPGRYKGGRTAGARIRQATNHFLTSRHHELERGLTLALALDDERERKP